MGRVSRVALTLRAFCCVRTSVGALTASVNAAGAMVPSSMGHALSCGAPYRATPFGLNGTDDDFRREPPRGTNGGFFLAEGASERARSHALMASIRARGRTLSRVHDAWALSRSTSRSRGFVTGSSIASECQMERGIHGKGIRRGVADIIASTSRSMHSAHDEWRAWTAAVTQRDVDRVLRRVNRRIETGVVALPKGSRCLEDDHSWIEADVALEPDFTAPCKVHETTHATPRGTLVFLHGFGDDAGHWREFTELLVRGIPGGFDVVLPAAPNRKFQIAGEAVEATAWFEPRMKHTREGGWDDDTDTPRDGSPWTCGGIDGAVAWTRRLVDGLIEQRGVAPGSVLVAGFSQGAGLALAAAEDRTSWSPALRGVLSLRGYLPRRGKYIGKEEEGGRLETFGTAKVSGVSPGAKPPQVLMCHGGDDQVAPRRWAEEAARRLRRDRSRYTSDVPDPGAMDEVASCGERVELMVCEGATHQLTTDDLWRARWWIRGKVEDASKRLPVHVPGMLL